MAAYFERLDRTRFRATDAVEGAWNTAEQHIAPVLGLIARDRAGPRRASARSAAARADLVQHPGHPPHRRRRPPRARGPAETHDRADRGDARPRRAQRGDRPRVALVQAADTAAIAEERPARHLRRRAGTVGCRRRLARRVRPHDRGAPASGDRAARSSGCARPCRCWRTRRSARPRALSVVDVANGATARVAPTVAAFPNLDLTVHLFRQAGGGRGGWASTPPCRSGRAGSA